MNNLLNIVTNTLSDMKARNINTICVKDITTFTDNMIFATGTSSTHVRAISENIIKEVKKTSIIPLGVEGQNEAEWVLVDLGSIIVHIMQASIREYYNVEKLWNLELINFEG